MQSLSRLISALKGSTTELVSAIEKVLVKQKRTGAAHAMQSPSGLISALKENRSRTCDGIEKNKRVKDLPLLSWLAFQRKRMEDFVISWASPPPQTQRTVRQLRPRQAPSPSLDDPQSELRLQCRRLGFGHIDSLS